MPPGLLHPEPLPLQQATADPHLLRRHSNTVPSQSLWGLWQVWDLILPLYDLAEASPLPLDVGYLFTVAPAPRRHHSSAYRLAGASLPLSTGSLQLMRRRDSAIRPIVECSLGMSPGQEGGVLRVKRQTQDFWSQQKQAHLDSQAHLGSWLKRWLV